MFQGHKGWIYTIEIHSSPIEGQSDRMFSGGDDRSIIIWDIEKGKLLE